MRLAAALGGLAVLVVAALLPDGSLSDHVVEHQLIVLVAAPLLVAAAPVRLALAALPPGGRRTLARGLHSWPARTVARPLVALALFCAVTAAAYVPAVMDAAEGHGAVHAVVHAALLWSAIALWMPAVAADPLPWRLGAVGRVALLLAAMTAMAVVGAIVATASAPLYAAHPDLADQRTAGGIMWMAGMIAALPAFLACAWAALHGEERRQRARELHGAGR